LHIVGVGEHRQHVVLLSFLAGSPQGCLKPEGALSFLTSGGAIAGLVQGTIALSQIEREYQSLAARAVGAPSARGSGFDDPAGDAVVLILRELMHHLGVVSLHGRD
jgi:hypothetical protein